MNKRLVELRSYRLHAGTGDDFHRIVVERAVPLLREWGTDVVAFGPSPHETDTYFLARSYADLADRNTRQDAFYGSDAWRAGPREAVVGKIEGYLDTVLWLSEAAIEDMRRLNSPEPRSPVDTWHTLVRTRDAKGLPALLADEVVFHSPVVHTPQVGKAVTVQYLSAAFQVFFNESFRYVREIVGARDAVLEFDVDIDGIRVNGIDMLRWNDEGRIVEFKVLIRPLKAINLIHQKMGAMLRAG
jgi:hypothetical protein